MPLHSFHRACVRALPIVGVVTLVGCGAIGCAATWDEVFSRRIREKPIDTLFATSDPLTVLRESRDGDERARAMRRLKEPVKNGRPHEQDEVVKLLTDTAVSDSRPLCRMAAVETLGRFEDPRVVPALIAAFHNAAPPTGREGVGGVGVSQPPLHLPGVQRDVIVMIQIKAVEGLAKHPTPESTGLLASIAADPAKPTDADPTGTHRADLKLAAIRALGHHRDRQAVAALVKVLQTEKDVAMRDRAHEGLKSITGRDLPAEGLAWEAALEPNFQPRPREPSGIERVGAWFNR